MEILNAVLITSYIIIALVIIVLVLIQHGKGASTGASFGGGASGSLFGAAGSANFLSRTTAVLITLFFVVSLAISYLTIHTKDTTSGSVIDNIETNQNPKSKNQEMNLPIDINKDSSIPSEKQFSVPSN